MARTARIVGPAKAAALESLRATFIGFGTGITVVDTFRFAIAYMTASAAAAHKTVCTSRLCAAVIVGVTRIRPFAAALLVDATARNPSVFVR